MRAGSGCGGGAERPSWVLLAGGVVVFGLGLVAGGAVILAMTVVAAAIAPIGLVLMPVLLLGLRALWRRPSRAAAGSGRLQALPAARRGGSPLSRPETVHTTSRRAA